MTNTATEAPLRRFRGAVDGLIGRVGRAIVAYTEVLSRSDELRRLSALSDGELAKMGLRRDEIVQHVFRDKIHL